ncbi:Alanine--glyoxylate aminotransferase [Daphnia magna]|uniref:Alanine--glyoxylate aminotransferase 2, mitochondrial n=1 Tax=Daphnia magna TaxID=35525 RepID=A0A164YDY3_9CRUS|nr:Alanine--glyoxylate aminotransferase [Daphnia magna]
MRLKAVGLASWNNDTALAKLKTPKGCVSYVAIEADQTQANCRNVGTYFLLELAKLRDEFPNLVGDVRGKGLMIGVELVSDPETRAPLAPADVLAIWEQCKDMGVLYGKGGFFGNVFRIKPPMCITKSDVDFAVAVLRKSIVSFLEK